MINSINNSLYLLYSETKTVPATAQAATKVVVSDVIYNIGTILSLYEQADEACAHEMWRLMLEHHKELLAARRKVRQHYTYNNNFTEFTNNSVKLSSEILAEFRKDFNVTP